MSLIETVVQMVWDRGGSATVDNIANRLHDYSRAQVLQALQNAAKAGKLESAQGKGLGPGKGKTPGRFSIPPGGRKGRPPSLTDRCIATVAELGKATAEEVFDHMNDKSVTLRQVSKALSNAVTNRRKLVTTRRAVPGTTTTQATYRAAPEDEDYLFTPNRPEPATGPMYPSVWAYGESFAQADYGTAGLRIPTLATAWNEAARGSA